MSKQASGAQPQSQALCEHQAAPTPHVHEEMAEGPISMAALKPLYLTRKDDELDLQGVTGRKRSPLAVSDSLVFLSCTLCGS